MRPPSNKDAAGKVKFDPAVKEAQVRRLRKQRQEDNELKFEEALVELQQRVYDSEGPELKDQMWDERYNWWIEQKRKTGSYPDNFVQFYIEKNTPPETPEERAAREEAEQKAKEDAAKLARMKKRGIVPTQKKVVAAVRPKSKKERDREAKETERLTNTTLIGPSEMVNVMLQCVVKYKDVWTRLDESDNYQQSHDELLARSKLRPVVGERIQKEVDIRLLAYLDNIKAKVQQRANTKKKTKKKKKKKTGKKTTGGKKSSKKKKKGKKKKKKCCDGEKQCLHMTFPEMVAVLVKMNILQALPEPKKHIKDFLGDMNFLGSAYENAGVLMDPSMQQLRQCLTEYFVLPLGSKYVKENCPLLNAVLLYGPHGSGKTLLAKAMASDTGATWFDLSPRNVERKLGSKLEIAKLVHMVFKVASTLPPSVIYVDEAEKVWVSSKNKKHLPDIVKMRNYIMQHKNTLDRTQRVMVVGNSRIPYNEHTDRKDLNNTD